MKPEDSGNDCIGHSVLFEVENEQNQLKSINPYVAMEPTGSSNSPKISVKPQAERNSDSNKQEAKIDESGDSELLIIDHAHSDDDEEKRDSITSPAKPCVDSFSVDDQRNRERKISSTDDSKSKKKRQDSSRPGVVSVSVSAPGATTRGLRRSSQELEAKRIARETTRRTAGHSGTFGSNPGRVVSSSRISAPIVKGGLRRGNRGMVHQSGRRYSDQLVVKGGLRRSNATSQTETRRHSAPIVKGGLAS